jgi:hypothetical protein
MEAAVESGAAGEIAVGDGDEIDSIFSFVLFEVCLGKSY